MIRLTFVIAAFVATVIALPSQLPQPGDLALVLNEEEFEAYLDHWLDIEQRRNLNASTAFSTGCSIRVNGDLGEPQPVYLYNGNYIVPSGNSGLIHLRAGEQIYVACTGPGRTIQHPNLATSGISTGWATCLRDAVISGSGWLNGDGQFGGIVCSAHSYHDAVGTSERCYDNNLVIKIGFYVDHVFYPLYYSCFDENRLEVLYVWYEQNPEHRIFQSGVARPNWLQGSFFPGVAVNNRYTQVQQKLKIAEYVGDALADKYVTATQFLSRGHLAAKTDFIFATGQRASFYFMNAAPQWQPFNAGNWNWLEQNLRRRIGEAGYHTTIYTGTFGVTQLRNQNGNLVDIYLHRDDNNNDQLPVPLYFYKVVYDSRLRLGTAYVSINNPYYTESEVRALTFCTDRCRNNNAFNWIVWQLDRIDLGYSFCCTIDEFRQTVPHLPAFEVDGLLA